MISSEQQQEVDKFNALADRWWDPNGPMKPLHQLNPLRLEYIQRYVSLADKTVLDVGCGAGLLSEALAMQGARVTAIDLGDTVIDIAKQHAEANNVAIDYRCQSIDQLSDEKTTFDIVTCLELLEHVPDPEQIIKACADVVKPGGYVFFSTVNRQLKAYLFAIIAAEYCLQLLPKGTHDYKKFIRPSELDGWARSQHLALQNIQGLRYRVLQDDFVFDRKPDVNYLVCYRKPSIEPEIGSTA